MGQQTQHFSCFYKYIYRIISAFFIKGVVEGACFSEERHSKSFLMQWPEGRSRRNMHMPRRGKAKRANDSKRGTKICEQKRPREKRPREGLLQFSSIHNPFQSSTRSLALDTALCLWFLVETFSTFPGWKEGLVGEDLSSP